MAADDRVPVYNTLREAVAKVHQVRDGGPLN